MRLQVQLMFSLMQSRSRVKKRRMESSEPHTFMRNADSRCLKFNLFGMYKDVSNTFMLVRNIIITDLSSSSFWSQGPIPFSCQTSIPPHMYLSIYITFRIRFSGCLFECFVTASIHRFVSAVLIYIFMYRNVIFISSNLHCI